MTAGSRRQRSEPGARSLRREGGSTWTHTQPRSPPPIPAGQTRRGAAGGSRAPQQPLRRRLQASGRPARSLPRPGLAVYSFSERKLWSRKLCRVFPAAMTDTITSQLRSTFRNRLILPAARILPATTAPRIPPGAARHLPRSPTGAPPAPAAHAAAWRSDWLRTRRSIYAPR